MPYTMVLETCITCASPQKQSIDIHELYNKTLLCLAPWVQNSP